MRTPPDAYAALDYERPPFDQLREFAPLLAGEQFPTLSALNAALATSTDSGGWQFVVQDQFLVRDGLHFEQRIFDHGRIATRPDRWHDLFSALVWLRYPKLKRMLNRLQVEDLPVQGRGNRTRRQQALTHIDEAGVLVASEEPELLAMIDAHAWEQLFIESRAAWGTRIVVHVFGHAIFELMRKPHDSLAGKALLFQVPKGFCARPFAQRAVLLDAQAAAGVQRGLAGWDPATMPSLPLSGVPGWRPGDVFAEYVRTAACFRPRPAGRVYAAPLR